MLSNDLEQRKNGLDAPSIPIPSTADELIAHFRDAGLESIRTTQGDTLLMAAGVENPCDDRSPSFDSGSE